MKPIFSLVRFFPIYACVFVAGINAGPNDTLWDTLWNGRDLTNWDKKIRYQAVNVDPNNTFRVSPCNGGGGNCLDVNYSNYTGFPNEPFGHIGYKVKPYSFYVLNVEYAFTGTKVSGGPGWADHNNGLMLHSQSAASMGKDQDFPTSFEIQLLGTENNGGAGCRNDMNLCTPGTQYHNQPNSNAGSLVTNHCNCSIGSQAANGVFRNVSALMMGDSINRHYINNQLVMTWYKGELDNGTKVSSGYVLLQAESSPTQFRKVVVANLVGCMTASSPNYKSYYIRHDAAACNVVPVGKEGQHASAPMTFNPATRLLSLNLEEKYAIKVADLNGKTVWEGEGSGAKSFDLSTVKPSGIYFLTLSRPGKVFTQKLLLGR